MKKPTVIVECTYYTLSIEPKLWWRLWSLPQVEENQGETLWLGEGTLVPYDPEEWPGTVVRTATSDGFQPYLQMTFSGDKPQKVDWSGGPDDKEWIEERETVYFELEEHLYASPWMWTPADFQWAWENGKRVTAQIVTKQLRQIEESLR